MFLSIWVYDKFLTIDECQWLVNYFETSKKLSDAKVYNNNDLVFDKSIRDSQTAWGDRNDENLFWLFQRLDKVMHEFNRYWFDVDYDRDGCDQIQYGVYHAGGYYDTHIDTKFIERVQVQRKLSCSVLLSDPSEFEGGELYINGGTLDLEKVEQGQIYAFPSIINHSVTKVKSGIRRSLVAWYQGRAWR